MTRKALTFARFDGGYGDNLPDEQMPDNMFVQADNMYWRSGLQKRGGISTYSSAPPLNSTSTIRGQIRAYINSAWYTVIAVDNATDVEFYYSADGVAWTAIGTSDWAKNYDVQFAYLNGYIIATNGQNDPRVIYYSGGWLNTTLDALDTRTRNNDDWYAGQYDASGTTYYIDDTTDAQDAGTEDFLLATGGTNNDGFYIAGYVTFTKVVFKQCEQFDGSPVAEYAYYNGSTWTTFTPTTAPSWTAAEGDKTLEFAYSSTWDLMGDTDPDGYAVDDDMVNKYVIRVRFTTAPTSSKDCDYLEISHTQYITQILGGEKPHHVFVHNNRIFLASGSILNFSPYNEVTGWNEYDIEYFKEGGETIYGLATHNEYLAVLKERKLFGFFGTSTDDWYKRSLADSGTVYTRSVVAAGDYLFWLDTDGIHAWDGGKDLRISKHVTLASTSGKAVAAINYDGDYFLAIGTYIYRIDPDTIKEGEDGEGRAAIYRYTGETFGQFAWHSGAGDNSYLTTLSNDGTNNIILRLENGNNYDGPSDSQSAIDCILKTKQYSFGIPTTDKTYGRIKVDTNKAGDWTFTIDAEHDTETSSVTISSGTGTGHYVYEMSVPYNLDGYDIGFYLRNNTVNDCTLYAISVDVGRRSY